MSAEGGPLAHVTSALAFWMPLEEDLAPPAPLAPVWIAGKAMIEGRRKFFPDSEPWPRAWEESDVWLENSISFGPKKSQSRAAGDTAKCPIPVEERTAGTRPAASQ